MKVLSGLLGACALGAWAGAFEDNRELLLDPSGGRWLLILPETSERIQLEALRVWTKMRMKTAEIVVEKGATFMGGRLLDGALNYGSNIFGALAGRGVAGAVEAVTDVA